MSTITHPGTHATYTQANTHTSILQRFNTWTAGQEQNRFMWLAIALVGHGCFLTPFTILMVSFTGMNLILFMLTLAAMAITLVTNLAALPARITIPVFFLSVLIDLAVIVAALGIAFGR